MSRLASYEDVRPKETNQEVLDWLEIRKEETESLKRWDSLVDRANQIQTACSLLDAGEIDKCNDIINELNKGVK